MPAPKTADGYAMIYKQVLWAMQDSPEETLDIPFDSLKAARSFRTRLYYFRAALGNDARKHPSLEHRKECADQFNFMQKLKFKAMETEDGALVRCIMAETDYSETEAKANDALNKVLRGRREAQAQKRVDTEQARLDKAVGSTSKKDVEHSAAPKVMHGDVEIKSSSEDGGQSLLDMFSNHGK